jgi:hypothetical protein
MVTIKKTSNKKFYYKNGQSMIEGKTKGGGRNVDDQNVDRPKISERRNGLFS